MLNNNNNSYNHYLRGSKKSAWGGFYLSIPEAENKTFFIATNKVLGEGSYGRVLLANPVVRGKINHNIKYAVKVCLAEQFNFNEARYLSRFVKTFRPIQCGNQIFLIQEFFSDGSLTDDRGQLKPAFKNLDILERLTLINQFALYVNMMHTNSPHTGEAFTHSDLKGQNVLTQTTSNGIHQLHVVDFGYAKPATENFIKNKAGQPIEQNFLYCAPESVTGESYAASDIFMMVEMIVTLLGAETSKLDNIEAYLKAQNNLIDSFNQRKNIALQQLAWEEIKLDNILNLPIKSVCIRFLKQMYHSNHAQRPNSEQVLEFFTALRLIYLEDHTRRGDYLEVYKYYQRMYNLLTDNMYLPKPQIDPAGKEAKQYALLSQFNQKIEQKNHLASLTIRKFFGREITQLDDEFITLASKKLIETNPFQTFFSLLLLLYSGIISQHITAIKSIDPKNKIAEHLRKLASELDKMVETTQKSAPISLAVFNKKQHLLDALFTKYLNIPKVAENLDLTKCVSELCQSLQVSINFINAKTNLKNLILTANYYYRLAKSIAIRSNNNLAFKKLTTANRLFMLLTNNNNFEKLYPFVLASNPEQKANINQISSSWDSVLNSNDGKALLSENSYTINKVITPSLTSTDSSPFL